MTTEIAVLLFGPDLPSAGLATTCIIEPDGLKLTATRQSPRFADLEARVGSFEHNQLQLAWQQQGQTWLIIPADLDQQKKLTPLLPHNTIAGLKQWQRATRNQNLAWKTLAYGLCTLTLATGLMVWQYDAAVSWLTGRIPLTTEYRLGKTLLTSLKGSAPLLDKGPAVEAIKKIGDRLTQNSAYHYQWHVSYDPSVNAFALPGGIVIVNKGLLEKADSANEVAGVLAHEIQHVEQRHSLKKMIASSGVAAAVLLVLGDANAIMMIMAHQASTQYFSRQTELDADMKGIALLAKKHINPQGISAFFQKMQGDAKSQTNGTTWLSSHPDTNQRINAVQNYLKAHPCESCETLQWDKKALLSSLKDTQPNTPKK